MNGTSERSGDFERSLPRGGGCRVSREPGASGDEEHEQERQHPRASDARRARRATGIATTRSRGATVSTKLTTFTPSDESVYAGVRNTSQTAGAAMTSDAAYASNSRRRSGSKRNQPTTRIAAMGSTTAACVACPRPASTIAHPMRPVRQHATAARNMAMAHTNGNCPSTGATMSTGLASTSAAHQPRRSSGKAQNVAATSPTDPITSHSVTTQSPSSGRRSAAESHGMNAYGNARP